jgi:hypothetical protein
VLKKKNLKKGLSKNEEDCQAVEGGVAESI